MTRLSVLENVSLDGVMQAPGRPDEDTRGGFAHGGWAVPYNDEVLGREMGKGMAAEGALVLGRRTYEDFAAFWPAQQDNPFTEVLDARTKYVTSNTLAGPLPWQNSQLLAGDPVHAVGELKAAGTEAGLLVLGSGVLVRALLRAGLVDELRLLILPLTLGTGMRLFEDGAPPVRFELAGSLPTTTGVTIATYRPRAAQST